jgi:sugar O-acyltransferase (sialic acid O-acetyltransferase NeuD family)
MKDLIILGGGVHAAEMVEIIERVNQEKKTWNLLGFLARKPEDVGKKFNDMPVLGTYENASKFGDASFAASNYNKLPWPLPVPMDKLISLVDPSAFVSRTAKVGRGCVVYPGCFIGLQAKLGDLVFLLANSVLNHNVVLEDRVIVTSGVVLAGGVHVEENCYLGQSCSIREKLRIGKGSLVGMGAVVVKDVPADCIVAGNPARKLKDRPKP